MLSGSAVKIDQDLGNEAAQESSAAAQYLLTDLHPVMRRIREPGTGRITGRKGSFFAPTWPGEAKHSKRAYAHTRVECEEKLKVFTRQMDAERKAIQDRLCGISSPDNPAKKSAGSGSP